MISQAAAELGGSGLQRLDHRDSAARRLLDGPRHQLAG
jgi:hypothetical protein